MTCNLKERGFEKVKNLIFFGFSFGKFVKTVAGLKIESKLSDINLIDECRV